MTRHAAKDPPSPTRSAWRLQVAASFAALALILASCQRVGIAPPVAPASAAACAAPGFDTGSWTQQRDSAGVTYRVPEGFTDRSVDLPYRELRYDGEFSGRLMIGFSPSSEHYTTLRRIPSPSMREMNECVADVNGRRVLLQAWRTEGGRFRAGERFDLFEVLALVPVEPTLTLYVTGGGATPRFQELVLAVARSVDLESR